MEMTPAHTDALPVGGRVRCRGRQGKEDVLRPQPYRGKRGAICYTLCNLKKKIKSKSKLPLADE